MDELPGAARPEGTAAATGSGAGAGKVTFDRLTIKKRSEPMAPCAGDRSAKRAPKRRPARR